MKISILVHDKKYSPNLKRAPAVDLNRTVKRDIRPLDFITVIAFNESNVIKQLNSCQNLWDYMNIESVCGICFLPFLPVCILNCEITLNHRLIRFHPMRDGLDNVCLMSSLCILDNYEVGLLHTSMHRNGQWWFVHVVLRIVKCSVLNISLKLNFCCKLASARSYCFTG